MTTDTTTTAKKKRPFGVTLLALLAILGGIVGVVHTLQLLHILPVNILGRVQFYTLDWLGALMWGLLALIYFWVFRMLWSLDPRGWLFVVAIATINLILAVVSILGQSTLDAMLPAIVVNGIILLYGLLPGTKAAFGTT